MKLLFLVGYRIIFVKRQVFQSATNLFEVSFIPWDKVTHINHAFLKVGKVNDGDYKLALTDEWADIGISFAHSDPAWDGLKGHFGEYKYYKSQYPNAKILVSVGGWSQTNHLSPIYTNPNDPTPNLNTDYVMKYYRDALNVPAAKLNIGTPYYSRGWSGVSGGTNGLYATGNSGASGIPLMQRLQGILTG